MQPDLDARPREAFVSGPTPLGHHPALAAALDLDLDLWVKRDDLTGPGLGGNKVRKLEYLVADAREQGADALVTVGSQQSNHCRLTAIAGAVAGFEVHLVLGDGEPEALEGNLALDAIAGAHLHHHATGDWAELAGHLAALTSELRAAGRRPYEVPLGGSTAIGALGYVRAWSELTGQLEAASIEPTAIVHASSSGGTQGGLLAGRALTGGGPLPVGVDVAKAADDLRGTVRDLADGVLALIGAERRIEPDDVVLASDGDDAPYGTLTDAAARAIAAGARSAGLIVDPVYSGRALGALPELERRGLLGSGPVVFLHTGGQPALFAGGYAADVVAREDQQAGSTVNAATRPANS